RRTAMPVSFAQIPAVMKQPLYWVEVDPSKAGLPVAAYKSLLVGTMMSTGAALPDVPLPIGRQADADVAFGQGSELARAFAAFFANNFANEVWALPLSEPAGTTPTVDAAKGTITITTAPTEAGTLHLYIGGKHVPVIVSGTDTVDNVAAAIVDAVTEDANL